MSVVVTLNFRALDGQAEAMLALLQEGRDFGLTVEGCEAYEVYQSKEAPHQFAMLERWSSVEAHQAHFETNLLPSGFFDRVVGLMVALPEVVYYVPR
jgi:quinol monooxygenase YgiN